jgi:hypothetical protein
MAQIIKHRRGGLESVSGATKRAGELLVITGSTGISAANDGLLFVGIDGSTVTPANKILSGSSTPNLTGVSYGHSVDGIPFYNTSEEKLYILGKDGNVEVKATASTNGTGIVSSSAQIDSLGFLKVNGDAVVSGSGQIDGTGITNNTITIAGNSTALGGSVTLAAITDGSGIVSGSSQVFSDVNGDISINSSGEASISSGVIENNDVNAAAGIVHTKLNFDGSGIVSGSSQISVTNAIVANDAAIDHSKIDFGGSGLTSGSLNFTVGDGSSTDTVQIGVDTLNIVGTSNEIETAVTDNQIAIGLVTNPTIGGNLTVVGNLEVQGTTTSVDSTTITLGDNILELNGSGAANGGLLVNDVTNPNTISGSLLWDSTNDYWKAGALGSEEEILLRNTHGVVSGSAQIALSGLSDYDSNDHIDHTSVTITAGDGLTGGGDISATRTLNVVSGNNGITVNADDITLNTASSTFTDGVKAKLTAEGVISSSAQIDGDFLNTNGDGVVSGSGQIDGTAITNNTITIAGNSTALGGSVSLANITDGSGIVSGSSQLTGEFDTRYLNTNGDGVVSGSGQIDGTAITNNTISGVALGSNLNNLTVDDSTIALNTGTTYNGSAARTVSVKSGGITDTHINASAAIDHTKIDFGGSGLTSGSLGLTISDGSSTDSVQVGVDTLSVVGTANEIETAVTDNQVQVGIVTNPTLSGNVTITGNLSVEGTTTTIDSTTVNIGDRILELNYGGASGDAGILVSDAVGGNTTSGSLLWDASEDYWMAGALGSEKEVARLNASPTSNTVLKADSNGLLVDSQITDDGTNVTIGGTAELRLNSATANAFAFFNGDKSLESVAASTAGDVIQYNGSSFVASNEIDGGTF